MWKLTHLLVFVQNFPFAHFELGSVILLIFLFLLVKLAWYHGALLQGWLTNIELFEQFLTEKFYLMEGRVKLTAFAKKNPEFRKHLFLRIQHA